MTNFKIKTLPQLKDSVYGTCERSVIYKIVYKMIFDRNKPCKFKSGYKSEPIDLVSIFLTLRNEHMKGLENF